MTVLGDNHNQARIVATFGALEYILASVYFALSGTIDYDESEIDEKYRKWIAKLERTLSDPLGAQIRLFEKEITNHPEKKISYPDDLIAKPRAAARLRNVL